MLPKEDNNGDGGGGAATTPQLTARRGDPFVSSPPPAAAAPSSSSSSSSSSSPSTAAPDASSAGFSVTKTLTKLLVVPTNRSCADCRSALVDSSQVHASFSPAVSNSRHSLSTAKVNNFRANHRKFTPPASSMVTSDENNGESRATFPKEKSATEPPMDLSLLASLLTGGHGVFVCALCGAAHKLLGPKVSSVYPVQNADAWTAEEVRRLSLAGGNARSWSVLERYMPQSWEGKRPKAESSIGDRLAFIRAKYEALAFVLPPVGPLSMRAWSDIVKRRHREWKGLSIDGLCSISNLDLSASSSLSSSSALASVPTRLSEPPDRLVEYFCVVTPSGFLDPSQTDQDLSLLEGPGEILLSPEVSDCFPSRDVHRDLDFPEHVSTFVCPDGCRPSSTALPPSFFTFVLTASSGDLLYGGALRLYDDDRDTDSLRRTLRNSGYFGDLPPFLLEGGSCSSGTGSHPKGKLKRSSSSANSDVIFVPKCLVILSRYPFFDLWRKFLLQIYRIALVEAPLPIERFIANFVCEVPLPPPGRIQVRCGFTVKHTWTIERPPENQLPMANFSYQPLFSALSVANIMVVWTCLLQETRVALLSRHYALLGPVAEALMSFLFPFHWQGLYLPVMPYKMLDILEAPVPYLVGLHSRYLKDRPRRERPPGVVFVDLDRDVVHLGAQENSRKPRSVPALPEREAAKLRSKLEEFAAGVYVMPASGRAGTITTDKDINLHFTQRPLYCQVNGTDVKSSKNARRRQVFGSTDKAYRDNELLVPISGFLSEDGQFYEREKQQSSANGSGRQTPLMFRFLVRRQSQNSLDSSEGGSAQSNILSMDEPPGFSSKEIRKAFLRFFVSLLRDYRLYLNGASFRSLDFLANVNVPSHCLDFVEKLLKTQMFQRFLEDRRANPHDPEVIFFDESINAKINRSKKTALTNIAHGGKSDRSTAFLDDTSGTITEHFAPPPPSNWGLPDDGRSYHYGSFPKLNPELFGKTRRPRQWQQNRRGSLRGFRRASMISSDKAILARAFGAQSSLATVSARAVKNLETAIGALSVPFAAPLVLMKQSFESGRLGQQNRKDELNLSRRGKPRDSSSALSDITLPSAFFDRNPEIVSTAEGVVLNARRKQAILLSIVTRFQALVRSWLARAAVRRLRREQLLRLPPLAHTAGIKLSRQRKCAVTVQSWIRAKSARVHFLRVRGAAVRLQSLLRGRRVRFAYLLLLRAVRRAQALARGYTSRMLVRPALEGRLSTYRKQIFLLWQRANTPLCYRTKFWPIINSTGFLENGVAEAELQRLWKELSISPPPNPEDYGTVVLEALRPGVRLGISNRMHWTSLKVESLVASQSLVGVQKDKTMRRGSLNWGPDPDPAAARVAAERMQIYDRLSTPTHGTQDNHQRLLDFYVLRFEIPHKEKKKKMHLAETVWTAYSQASLSAGFMLDIFPELLESTNINFVEPSKKAARRFRGSERRPEPLGSTMWAHTVLRERTRRNMHEVASVSLLRVPSLTLRLEAIGNARRQIDNKRQAEAAMHVRRIPDWPRCRLQVMKELLSSGKGFPSTWAANGKTSEDGPKQGHPLNEEHPDANIGRVHPGENFWKDAKQ